MVDVPKDIPADIAETAKSLLAMIEDVTNVYYPDVVEELIGYAILSERERRTAQGVKVPEGWVLVPVDPTLAMLAELHISEAFTTRALQARYQAMLAAAPSLSTSAGGGERG